MSWQKSSRVCLVCRSRDHTERNCPYRHYNQRARPVSSYRRDDCRICGRVGHFARICPKYTADRANETLVFDIDRLSIVDSDDDESVVDSEDDESSVVDSDDDESIFTELSYRPPLQDGLAYTKDAKVLDVKGKEVGHLSVEKFEDPALGLGENELLTNIVTRCGFTELTTIQKHALPLILSGKDVLACAHTGTGKTGAFLIPLVKLLSKENTSAARSGEVQHPRALIISPTRELAIQIYNEARKFAFKIPGCKPRLAYGGASMKEQREEMKKGCDILVGVPGRVRHFVEEGAVCLENLSHFVMDEADKMLDMGFIGEMKFLADSAGMPPTSARQTLMFSATFSRDVQDVAKDFLKEDPRFVGVGGITYSKDLKGFAGVIKGEVKPLILQEIEMLEREQKKPRLREILHDLILIDVNQQLETYIEISRNEGCNFAGFMDHVLYKEPKNLILIFVETKNDAKDLRTYLCDYLTRTYVGIFRQRFPDSTHDKVYDIADTLNGDMKQMDRERVLSDFKKRKFPILVATNVAARGLDIEKLTHVINYDMPRKITEYINRVGRTGRAGRSGTSISFLQPDRDSGMAEQLLGVLGKAEQGVPQWLQNMTNIANMTNRAEISS